MCSCIAPSCSLQNLPVELISIVCLDLSIKDLCFFQAVSVCCICLTLILLIVFLSSQTNHRLHSIISSRDIWRDVIRDILTVKPLLRLSYAYIDMTSSELRGTAMRLAAQDKLLQQDRKRPLVPKYSFEVDGIGKGDSFHQIPVLLPGGTHFVLPDLSVKELRVFKTDGTPESVGLLVPKRSRPICYWKTIPTSADELLVATVTGTVDLKKNRW
jgi:hypothetical protein